MREGLSSGSSVSFFATDHLGSTAATIWANGNGRSQLRYDPWGKQRYAQHTTPTGYRYTSQRWDSGLGLYDYNARYYDPAIGRFISADTLVPDPAAPQAFNRYAYVLGNPLRYTDPTGHLTKDELEKYFGIVSEEQAIDLWGTKLGKLLWHDEKFTWGDVIDHDGGSAMLVLFETMSNKFRGGFWGISGDCRGYEVSANYFKASDKIEQNAALANSYRDLGWEFLPHQRDFRGRNITFSNTNIGIGVDAVEAAFMYTGVLALVSIIGFTAYGVIGGLGLVAALSKAPMALNYIGMLATAGGFAVHQAEKIFGATWAQDTTYYPVIRNANNNPGGVSPITLSLGKPGY